MSDKLTKLEIAGLEILGKRLKSIESSIGLRCAQDAEKWHNRQQHLAGFEDIESAQDAYGYGDITADELRAITEGLTASEPKTKYTIAHDAVCEFIASLDKELRDLRWSLLSDAEKDRINQQHTELAERIAKKREVTN